MSDNLSFLLTCAAECLNNWGYDGHGKHVDDGVKEITRLRAENKKLRAAFRVNMLRAFPHMSHDEIDTEIAAAIRETE